MGADRHPSGQLSTWRIDPGKDSGTVEEQSHDHSRILVDSHLPDDSTPTDFDLQGEMRQGPFLLLAKTLLHSRCVERATKPLKFKATGLLLAGFAARLGQEKLASQPFRRYVACIVTFFGSNSSPFFHSR